ncbi:hypothetical protein SAMN06264365_12844 [Actinoplanes regularis]|uniref:Uncharacterized protein n=1 Tax=Actinoplanes regularis TaxID=52697 RepID=A0A239IC89_9ACTN|nr:hypothetical protein SAMN06264365_12844 [Actinoplanes regularis]
MGPRSPAAVGQGGTAERFEYRGSLGWMGLGLGVAHLAAPDRVRRTTVVDRLTAVQAARAKDIGSVRQYLSVSQNRPWQSMACRGRPYKPLNGSPKRSISSACRSSIQVVEVDRCLAGHEVAHERVAVQQIVDVAQAGRVEDLVGQVVAEEHVPPQLDVVEVLAAWAVRVGRAEVEDACSRRGRSPGHHVAGHDEAPHPAGARWGRPLLTTDAAVEGLLSKVDFYRSPTAVSAAPHPLGRPSPYPRAGIRWGGQSTGRRGQGRVDRGGVAGGGRPPRRDRISSA